MQTRDTPSVGSIGKEIKTITVAYVTSAYLLFLRQKVYKMSTMGEKKLFFNV